MTTSDWITLFGALATLVGVAVAFYTIYRQLDMMRKQMILQHFSDYTKRYQEIIQKFPEDVNTPDFQFDPSRNDNDLTMRAMRAYFDLCFEEWYLWKREYLDKETWEIWKKGMITALSKQAFQTAWEKIKSDTEYGHDFLNFVTRELLPKLK
jgi:hypothetical protein